MNRENKEQIKNLKRMINQRYKPSFFNTIKNSFENIFLIIAILLGLLIIIFLIFTLIENPISLAIICLTILIMWMWGSR